MAIMDSFIKKKHLYSGKWPKNYVFFIVKHSFSVAVYIHSFNGNTQVLIAQILPSELLGQKTAVIPGNIFCQNSA